MHYLFFFAVASSPENAKNRDDTFVLTDTTNAVPQDYVEGSSAVCSPTSSDAHTLDSPQPPNGQETSKLNQLEPAIMIT